VPGPSAVDQYIAALPSERRPVMQTLRDAIKAGAPEAVETIAYGMPAFRSHGGQFLVSYDAYKAHYSLFPASGAVEAALGAELMPYLTGKGTIRFPADRPIPAAMVTKVASVRFGENAAREAR
jgi:uncharacterized protein YdhG (YjbR/CyaY superfamily)